jgi:hypothetical protein
MLENDRIQVWISNQPDEGLTSNVVLSGGQVPHAERLSMEIGRVNGLTYGQGVDRLARL